MVQGLKGHAQAIYDVTIAYSGDLFRMPDGTILRETAPSMGGELLVRVFIAGERYISYHRSEC